MGIRGFFMKNLVEGLPPPFEHVFDPPTGPRRPTPAADRRHKKTAADDRRKTAADILRT